MTSTDASPGRRGRSGDRRRRPWGIVLLMVVAVLQGLLLLLVGAALVIARDDPGILDLLGNQQWVVMLVAVVLVVLGLARIGLAVLLGRGIEWVRLVFGGLAVVQVALASYAVVAVEDLGAVTSLLVAVVELWLLYGSERTREFFQP